MNPFALVQFFSFLKAVKDAIPDDNYAQSGVTNEQLKQLKILHKKILKQFKAGIVTICVILPALINLNTLFFDPIEGDERMFRFGFPWIVDANPVQSPHRNWLRI